MEAIDKLILEFKNKLNQLKNSERAKKEKAYLKSPDQFYGVSVWEINNIVKEFRKKNPTLEKDKLFKLTTKLWNSPSHEEKTIALKLLESYSSYLSLKDMDLLERMLNQSSGWAHVDEIACHLVSSVLGKNKQAYSYLKKWATSDNFWLRRASVISQILLFREGKGDKELFFAISQKLLHEKEFFVRKAIGWTLREMSKTDPESVANFLKKYKDRMSELTFREGSRKLPTQFLTIIN